MTERDVTDEVRGILADPTPAPEGKVVVPKTITFRLSPELRLALETEIAALAPYSPTLTTVMERGVAMALAEMRERRERNPQ